MRQLWHVHERALVSLLHYIFLQLHPQPPLPSPITFFNCHRCGDPRCAFGAAAVGCVCVHAASRLSECFLCFSRQLTRYQCGGDVCANLAVCGCCLQRRRSCVRSVRCALAGDNGRRVCRSMRGGCARFSFLAFKQKLQHLSSGARTLYAFRTGCPSSFGWACGCATAAGLHHNIELLTRCVSIKMHRQASIFVAQLLSFFRLRALVRFIGAESKRLKVFGCQGLAISIVVQFVS
jgi:hypothetical protein